MAFLTSCPDCGHSQICVLSLDGGPHLRCARCRAIYPSVWEGEELALASTLAEDAYESAGGTDTLVVVQNLPSVYPGQKRKKRRKAKRRERYPVALPALAELIDLAAVTELPQPVVEPPPPEPVAAPADSIASAMSAPVIVPPRTLPTPPRRRPVRRADDDVTDYGRLQLNAAAILTLFLVVGALASASFESATGVVRPLAAVCVALGLVAVVTSGLAGRRLLIPVALTGIGVALFIVSFAAPQLLGLTYSRSREPWNEPAEVQVIPHLQFAGEAGLRSAEWVDASKAALQQGGTKVEVVDARMERVPQDGQSVLTLRVRLHQQTAIVASTGWKDEIPAMLRDIAGTVSEQRPPVPGRSGADAQSVGDGATVSDALLAFSVPAGARGPFRLELSARAWGGAGTFKFDIPSSMVKR